MNCFIILYTELTQNGNLFLASSGNMNFYCFVIGFFLNQGQESKQTKRIYILFLKEAPQAGFKISKLL